MIQKRLHTPQIYSEELELQTRKMLSHSPQFYARMYGYCVLHTKRMVLKLSELLHMYMYMDVTPVCTTVSMCVSVSVSVCVYVPSSVARGVMVSMKLSENDPVTSRRK